jgi:predicted ATP-grasp superfamily ATP-dependent carboligase
MDLVRPLGLAGIRSAVVAKEGDLARYSRFTCVVIDWVDSAQEPEELLGRLIQFAARQPQKPVLYYGRDWDLLFVSRFRDRLRQAFRFVVPEAALVEDVVDKVRFQALAERLDLPVPRGFRLHLGGAAPDHTGLGFPLILKPITRDIETWAAVGGLAKAVRVNTPQELRDCWSNLSAKGLDVVVQELIPGPERLIESYHAYVDEQGEFVGEFTGRKIRTYPSAYGYSTALETTASEDVAALGRELARRLELWGVVKFDFKRAPDGSLRLLDVNPRFNLWHHLGAKAGVNLPFLVYADVVGLPRPEPMRARAGVRWVYNWHDARAARRGGMSLLRWLPWALSVEAKSGMAWDDPMPVLRGSLSRLSRRFKLARGTWSPDRRSRVSVKSE